MVDPERIYAALPAWLQEVMLGLKGWQVNHERYDRDFHSLLAECEGRTFWSPEQVAQYRDQRLSQFVADACRTTPYYRELFKTVGLDPRDIHTVDDLKALPVLSKADVKRDPERFCADAPGLKARKLHTSGTTGGGLHMLTTAHASREQWACWWRYRRWHGLAVGQPCLYFGGRAIVPIEQKKPPFWRYNAAAKQLMFSAYHLGPETAPYYLDEMARHENAWVHGYPSLVSLIASYTIERGAKLDVKWVTLGAESLLPHQAQVIAKAFNTRALEHYGMTEAVANISLCPAGKLHVDEDFAAMEFVPIAGDAYNIVGTNVTNPAFPLLRYEVGDVATITGQKCDCGRPGRVVDSIDGRIEDFVITRSGARLGRMDHIFKDMVNAVEVQVEQHRIGHATFKIVKGPAYGPADEALLKSEAAKRVGDQLTFDIQYVDKLPRTNTGKLRMVVSTITQGQLQSVADSLNPPGG